MTDDDTAAREAALVAAIDAALVEVGATQQAYLEAEMRYNQLRDDLRTLRAQRKDKEAR